MLKGFLQLFFFVLLYRNPLRNTFNGYFFSKTKCGNEGEPLNIVVAKNRLI